MSDPLDRAVDAQFDAHRPDTVPPFAVIEGRKRGRDRRRAAVAGAALSAAALAGAAVVVPSLAGDGDRLTPGVVTGPDRTSAAERCAPGTYRDRTQDYRGLTEQQAQDKARGEGGITTVAVRDGDCQNLFTGRNPRRVMLSVVDGKVVWAGQDGEPRDTAPATGESAVWDIDPARPPRAQDLNITVMVSRLGCASGETGEVYAPSVQETADTVVVTFAVAPLPAGDYACPGNKPVAYSFTLDSPLGDRPLVDGACDSKAARTTSLCLSAQRWPTP